MSTKSLILRNFNNHFFEFMDDIISIYPENVEIAGARNSFDAFRKANPILIAKAWHKFIYIPYNELVEKGDITLFIEKDYSTDLAHLKNVDKVMLIIDKIRAPIRSMSESNKAHTTKYLQNLCKLSALYTESV
jgi:hypothetical protein